MVWPWEAAGFEPATAVYAVPCTVPASGDAGAEADVLLPALIGVGLLTIDAGRRMGRRTLPAR